VTHPRGRQPIGVCQPPGASGDYPFAAPSADVALLLGDFYLAYEDTECGYVLPLRVSWLYGFGTNPVSAPSGTPTPAHDRDLVVKDADGAVVFDSTTAAYYEETEWGGRLLVVQWQTADAVCRCTVHTEWSPEHTAVTYDDHIEPDSGVLDARTYERMPARVRGIRVGNQTFTGKIVFQSGNNVDLTGEAADRTDGGEFVNAVTIDAVPGAGLGRQPGCESTEVVLRRINQSQPDDSGNLVIEMDDCLRLQIPLTVTGDTATYAAESTLQIHSECTPCCACEDYVNTYRGLKAVWDRWRSAAASAEATRDVYHDNRDRWNDQRDCRLASPARLLVNSERNCRLFVGGSFCNMTPCCVGPIEFRFTLLRYVDGVEVAWVGEPSVVEAYVRGSSTDGEEAYAPQVDGPVIRFTVDFARRQQVSTVRFRVCTPCQSNESVSVVMTVHAPDPVPGEGVESCDLPAASTPAGVAAVWSANGVPAGDTVRASASRAAPLNPEPPSFVTSC
jgi:hypothetical protein